MEKQDIKMGDTVALRNGETIVVDYTSDSYSDRTGEHPGPWVISIGKSYDRYLLADVVEVVAHNPRLCKYCGEGVTAKTDHTDFCRNCFYSGRAFDDIYGDLLGKLRSIDGVTDAYIEHTGGGCFLLAVSLADGRIVTCTEYDAVIPDPGDPWGVVVVQTMEQWESGEGDHDEALSLVTEETEEMLSDDQLVDRIKSLVSA